MELNTVLFAGIGAGVVVGMLLGIGLMCWLVMARNDPISAEEDPDTHAQLPGWPPLPEEIAATADLHKIANRRPQTDAECWERGLPDSIDRAMAADMSCAASGCALADGNCDQGRKCPRRAA